MIQNNGALTPGKVVPFADRLACTVDEACSAVGLGRTKLYELIGEGQIETTSIRRRRLVLVRSLVALIDGRRRPTNLG